MPRPADTEAIRIGRILRLIREERGLTQAQVAERLGKGEGAYAAYESGRSRFTVPELPDVARALGVSTVYVARQIGLCGDDNADIATTLVERLGPRLGGAIVQIDRFAALLHREDVAALAILLERFTPRGTPGAERATAAC